MIITVQIPVKQETVVSIATQQYYRKLTCSYILKKDAKKAIVEVVEEEDLPPIPEYTNEQITKLMMFIQHITTVYDLTEDDIGVSFMVNVTNWLLNVTETILFVYFDCGFLCASPQVPASPVNSLTYFIREEPCFVFSVSFLIKCA